MLSDNGTAPYNPMLTTYYVSGAIAYDQLFPFGAGNRFYEEYRIRAVLGSPVVAIDVANRTVANRRGLLFPYDKCLIATGARPILPPIPGIRSARVHTMRTVKDALALKEAIAKGPRRAVVVGASLVGIKLVELFTDQGIEVCLADMASHLFPTAAHSDCARIMESRLLKRGIQLRLGAAIEGIEESSSCIRAYFMDGDPPAEADLLVMCIGVKSNMEFLEHRGVATDKGVLVDRSMKTNISGLYAAGDVAQAPNLQDGKHQLVGLWANARYQGRAAGRHMSGHPLPHAGDVSHNVAHFMHMTFASIGNVHGFDRETKFIEGDTYAQLFWTSGNLTGANLINCDWKAGVFRQKLAKELILGHVGEKEAASAFGAGGAQCGKQYLFLSRASVPLFQDVAVAG
jgi:3-phenylpropionate/trans-cinnamate dioxygenase ferredoxin reductase subunit